MRWFSRFPLSWRTGATFVHDTVFLGLVVSIAGHILIATRDSEALGGMTRGTVSVEWAERHYPRWADEARPK